MPFAFNFYFCFLDVLSFLPIVYQNWKFVTVYSLFIRVKRNIYALPWFHFHFTFSVFNFKAEFFAVLCFRKLDFPFQNYITWVLQSNKLYQRMKTCIIFIIDDFLLEFYYGWLQEEFWLFGIAGYYSVYHFVFDEILDVNWKLELIESGDTWLKH